MENELKTPANMWDEVISLLSYSAVNKYYYYYYCKQNITASKSAYYYDFWRSCETEDCSNDAENTALITEINYSLKYIKIETSYFKL